MPFSRVSKRQQILGWWVGACQAVRRAETQCHAPAQCPPGIRMAGMSLFAQPLTWKSSRDRVVPRFGLSLGPKRISLRGGLLLQAGCCQPSCLGGDGGPALSPPWEPPTNSFAGGMAFCCWTWALLDHGMWEGLRITPAVPGRDVQEECRLRGTAGITRRPASVTRSLARRTLRINRSIPGRFAGMPSAVLPWVRCYRRLS